MGQIKLNNQIWFAINLIYIYKGQILICPLFIIDKNLKNLLKTLRSY